MRRALFFAAVLALAVVALALMDEDDGLDGLPNEMRCRGAL